MWIERASAPGDRVEDFLQRRWIPAFLGRFVETSRLMDDLLGPAVLTDPQRRQLIDELGVLPASARGDAEAVVTAVDRALANAARGQMVLEFSQAALDPIERQRRELIGPINEMEREAIAAKAREWTNRDLAGELARTTPLTDREIERLLPTKLEKEQFADLLSIVADATETNAKVDALRSNIDRLGPVLVKVLRLVMIP